MTNPERRGETEGGCERWRGEPLQLVLRRCKPHGIQTVANQVTTLLSPAPASFAVGGEIANVAGVGVLDGWRDDQKLCRERRVGRQRLDGKLRHLAATLGNGDVAVAKRVRTKG